MLGVALAALQWWAYFDVVAIVATDRLASLPPGREQNTMARDSYSYLHFPMVAGIVLVALGLKKTLEHTGDPLKSVAAVALAGGAALYLLAHVAFRLRNIGTLNVQRLVVAGLLLALIPVGMHVPGPRHLGTRRRAVRRADRLRGDPLRHRAGPDPPPASRASHSE